jgi:DNA-binding transcriptional ArsR family regulator
MTRPRLARDVFHAIADPTRRRMLDMLVEGEKAVSALAKPFAVSMPAVSQHLRVLKAGGLVTERRAGRERYYKLNPWPLREVADWARHFELFWTARFEALDRHLARKR